MESIKKAFAKIQWSVVLSILRTLCTIGGAGSTFLLAVGYSPVQVNSFLGTATAALSVIAMVGPGIWGAFTHTNSAQVANVAAMPAADQLAALNKVPDAAKVTLAASVPGASVEVNQATASPAVIAVAQDTAQPNVSIKAA